ncbi:MAG: lipid IV(A) 3-deoxy-D-manno-octulosonic acid transferase [Herminiimonas sp.]|nr:lipid IV(A) 3-deoxy-D-manno-octulosonic acid transferase [Herminiimonas sp.]
MRLLYSMAWWLALPVVLGRLWWRGRAEPGYRRHMPERLGSFGGTTRPAPDAQVLWVHAVSVGETRAAEPLIDALLAHYPHHVIVLTHMTPTGRATGRDLYARHATRIVQCYLPYDIGPIVSRFLEHFKPLVCILMETEVWPNVVHQCERRHIPVLLANARMSERSLAKGRRLATLMGAAARALTCVAAQTDADAMRLRMLGAPRVEVTGSIKFDVTPPPAALSDGAALRAQFGRRPVLLCASTRDGEEALILDALIQADVGDTLVIIVPRHPQRFEEVARAAVERGLTTRRRSLLGDQPLSADVRVLVGDSMGEMFVYLAASDLAFIGGSLLPLGGQNLIEACALGKPVLIGPHTFNFSVVSEAAIAAGAALRVTDAAMLLSQAVRLLHDDVVRQRMGMSGSAFAKLHRGATARTMRLLTPMIDHRQDT